MYYLTVRSHFDAAHFLRGYPGPCANMHGHSFKYEVTIKSMKLDELGMMIDFKEVKKTLKERIESVLDHANLNDIYVFDDPEDTGTNPTAENLARAIYKWLKKTPIDHGDVYLEKVTVWESDDCSVEYKPDERD